jgi:hypothetical protein
LRSGRALWNRGTVASLSNTGSLVILCLGYLALHIILAAALAFSVAPYEFGYWFGWIAVWTLCVLAAAYVYTHLKFTHLPGYYFWDVIHLTDFRQKFYDQYLNPLVTYARHALSIDERRNDFQRVPWGGRHTTFTPGAYKIDPFEQLWFAGNHADIGGGYPENRIPPIRPHAELRAAEDHPEQLAALVTDLVRRPVDIIVGTKVLPYGRNRKLSPLPSELNPKSNQDCPCRDDRHSGPVDRRQPFLSKAATACATEKFDEPQEVAPVLSSISLQQP